MKSLLEFYQDALAYAVRHDFDAAPFKKQIEWQRKVRFEDIDAKKLFWEYVWVVLASGFKVKIAREFHRAFYESGNGLPIACDVSKIYNNARKKEAIREAQRNYLKWFEILKLSSDKLEFLDSLPFIGSITKYHLAKNLGLDVAKPDVHLLRLCEIFHFKDAQSLCEYIATHIGERVSVIDLVLWFYCAENPGYKQLLRVQDQQVLA
jgi:hypothetical protein